MRCMAPLGVFLQASLLSNLRRVAIPVSGNSFLGAFWSQAMLYPTLYAALIWVVLPADCIPRRGPGWRCCCCCCSGL